MVDFDPFALPGGVDVAGLGQQLVENLRVDRGLAGGDLDWPALWDSAWMKNLRSAAWSRAVLGRTSVTWLC
ncbi:hypothetical protein CC117_25905 [Parafrankia colletiae]|uniref:Uncharacterized protein n=1 Tax=Parafrankia colletiae TaxID=573497 RepID=A0A1S1QDC0_9ACTN|nr:hypothetical protein CC117_25905 [Parafrankia colletiae]